MKICIFGAGAVGANFAVRLACQGHDVSVVARGAHLAAIKANGLSVTWNAETLHATLRATDDAAALPQQDAVIVTLKAPAITGAARAIAGLLGDDTPVVFAVNGLPWWYRTKDGATLTALDPGGTIEAAIGRRRAVGGVVYVSSAVTQPGHVLVVGKLNGLVLGEPDGGVTPRVQALAKIFSDAGVWSDAIPQIGVAIWRKLGLNIASGPLAVLAGAALPTVYKETALAHAARALLAETASIAAAEGFDAANDPDLYMAEASILPHKPSILQDLEAGRPMEVAQILDGPLEVAKRHGVDTPVLALITALVRIRAQAAGLFVPAPSPPNV